MLLLISKFKANTRFESAKASVLDALPPSATAEDREEALSHFYRHWLVNENARQQQYSADLRARTRQNLFLSARVWYRTWRAKLGVA
jgi:apoptogenic protein 1